MDIGVPIPKIDHVNRAQHNTRKTLNRVLAEMYPESFYHSIWQVFSEQYRNPSNALIQNLIQSAQQLQMVGDIRDACQILLVCAVLQSRSNDIPAALITAQQALELAQKNNLNQVSNWSAWGVCALCVNSGDYQSAVKILSWLQTKLRQEDQWILANHLELIKTTLTRGPDAGRYFEINRNMFSRWGEPRPIKGSNRKASFSKERVVEQYPINHLSVEPRWMRLKKTLKKLWGQLSSRWTHSSEGSIQANVQNSGKKPSNALPIRRRSVKMDSFTQKNGQKSMMKLKTMLNSINNSRISLTVQMLGEFRVALNDKPIVSFPRGRARSVFEYMVFHNQQNIPREVLMDLFWPEVDPKSARNSLNVAVYNIRKALKTVMDYPVILFNDGTYGLNPDIEVWIDVEEFDRNNKMAQKLESQDEIIKAMSKLEIAANLYQGDFLAEDPYETWTVYQRQRLRADYMDILCRLCRFYYDQGQFSVCATLCQLLLKYDNCNEEAHCHLMRCYGRLNQYHLAIRQYHICADALKTELGVEPAVQTVKLYERARRREHTQPL